MLPLLAYIRLTDPQGSALTSLEGQDLLCAIAAHDELEDVKLLLPLIAVQVTSFA